MSSQLADCTRTKLTWRHRTHKAAIDQDSVTGRKIINQYEILDEIGRGVHGKVKLARNLETGEKVAIKIIQRFSKKRRLGKVTVSPEEKTKREIAILKKIRHPNVVGLYEVIDDPDYSKIYMILEYVELGEIKWRRKGITTITAFERRRIERELRGEDDLRDEEKLFKIMEARRVRKEAHRARLAQQAGVQVADFWSLEHGDDEEDDYSTSLSRTSTRESLFAPRSYQSHTSMVRSNPASAPPSRGGSRAGSRATSRAPSRTSSIAQRTPLPDDGDPNPYSYESEDDEDETPGPLPIIGSAHSSATGLFARLRQHGSREDTHGRGRSPSVSDSIISHMSSVDDIVQHDAFEDDFSYVPCFTMDQARQSFRDTVLGLEYLHYEGIVHRDIKPANLLWTREHRVKISDFGVSYFGRPVRDGEPEECVSEADAHDFDDDLELSKTVGTPAFFAPELCFTDLSIPQPKITEQIDVWSLGVTLYCMVFARIPFLAEDEYQLFRAIAQQDAHIPKRRLKPVRPDDPTWDITGRECLYRKEGELVMEEIDDELYDLLKRMLVKDPNERIKLREVKRHPWVVRGIDNVIGWLDDTDPSRKTQGRRIEVDDRELERAVVPISFVERARSAVKKAVGKVLGRSDTSRTRSRKRATSTATSSGDGGQGSPATPARDARRASLRGDEPSYFEPVPQSQYLPLQELHTTVPNPPATAPATTALASPLWSPAPKEGAFRPPPPDRTHSTAASIKTVIPFMVEKVLPHHTKEPQMPQPQKTESSPLAIFTDHLGGAIRGLKNTRSMDLKKATAEGSASRAQSAGPSKTVIDSPHRVGLFGHHHSRSSDVSISQEIAQGHHFFRPSPLSFGHKHAMSSPLIGTLGGHAANKLEDRPSTATRTAEARTPPRLWTPPIPNVDEETRRQEASAARLRLQEAYEKRSSSSVSRTNSTSSTRPVSRQMELKAESQPQSYQSSPLASPAHDGAFRSRSRFEDVGHTKSSSSINSYDNTTMSPADASGLSSPMSSTTLDSHAHTSHEQFPSHPSLPALISGGSSVSADHDVVPDSDNITQASSLTITDDSPDTATPPGLSKSSTRDTPPSPGIVDQPDWDERTAHEMYAVEAQHAMEAPPNHYSMEADDSDDSDEGLTMGKRHSKLPPLSRATSVAERKRDPSPRGRRADGDKGQDVTGRQRARTSPQSRQLERRGTNCSVGSTGTAKRVVIDD
jgi:[calcium/calmodulin-dependent protein kinase] kinase